MMGNRNAILMEIICKLHSGMKADTHIKSQTQAQDS